VREGATGEFGGLREAALERDSDWGTRLAAGSAAMFGIIIVPALIHHAVRPGKDESWKQWFRNGIISQFGGQVPLVNTMTYGVLHDQRDVHVSPFDKVFKTFSDVYHDANRMREGKKAEKFLKHVAQAPQVLLGIGGTDQTSTAAQYVYDVLRQKEAPRSVMEWGRGLITGKSKPQKGYY
jgi:hypothetical protein